MRKYVYRHKKTGKKVYSDKPIADKDLVLVTATRDARIKSAEVITK